jgi:vacuolar protein sorting-associated protein 29
MITGHTHSMHYIEQENTLFINPGSLTGSRTVINNNDQIPSFMLLDINGASVVTYTYQLKKGEVDVTKKEFKKIK